MPAKHTTCGTMRAMRTLGLMVSLCLLACSREPSKRTQQQLEDLLAKKAAAAKAEREKELKLTPLNVDVVRLEPPWDDGAALVITPDGKCPEGLWALFPKLVPGSTPEEKKANEAQRKTLAESLAKRTFIVKLHAPQMVTLQPFDAPNGRFVIDVAGTIDCTDPTGRIAIAWSDVKAVAPPSDNEVVQNIWQAKPVQLTIPMTGLSEAKAFYEKQRFTVSARVVLTPGKTEIDRKIKHIAKISREALGETVGYGGGDEDWGAGPVLHGELVGVRVATDREKTSLAELRK